MNPTPSPSQLMVFLFTDLVNSTSWKKEIGDPTYTSDVLQPHNRMFRELLVRFGGAVERNFMGDGFLATFRSPSEAVNFALFFQYALREHAWSDAVLATGKRPQTRIGIHVGEAIEYSDQVDKAQVSGQSADLGARVMGLAVADQILLTRHAFDSARQYVRSHPVASDPPLLLDWQAHGPYRFKGKEDDSLEVFEVGTVGRSPLVPPPDGEKAWRSVSTDEVRTLGWRPSVGASIPGREDFIVERQLGEGGFGEVWLARQKETRTERVFKFCFDPDRLRSFQRELAIFRLLQSELGHRDDIVYLHSVRTDKPPYFLESDYIPAGNLTQWAEKQGGIAHVPLSTRLRLLAEVARPVAEAHRLGIIHKDLKPSNILIDENRRPSPQDEQPRVAHPRVIDFGIGVVTDRGLLERHGIQARGWTMSILAGNSSSRTGTRLYAAPETLTGPKPETPRSRRSDLTHEPSTVPEPASAVTPASLSPPKAYTTAGDVYALGVMLFQLVVADLDRPLGTGWQEEVLQAFGSEPSDYGPSQLLFELLLSDITAATYRDPEKRLDSASEFAKRLEDLPARIATLTAERETEIARIAAEQRSATEARQFEEERREAAHRAAEQSRRLRLQRRLLVTAMMVLISIAVLALDVWRQRDNVKRTNTSLSNKNSELNQTNNKLNESIERERKARDDERQAKKDIVATLARNNFYLADARWKSNHIHEAVELLDAIPTEHRHWEWGITRRQIEGSYLTFYGHGSGVDSVTWSRDGSLLASGGSDGIKLWDTQTGAELRTLASQTHVNCVAFSPDGSQLVSAGKDSSIKLWEARTGVELATLTGHSKRVASVAFNSDGSLLVSGSEDHTIRLWDVRTRQAIRTLAGHTERVTGVAISPDGTRIASSSWDTFVRLWDTRTGRELQTLSGHSSLVNCVAFSPDGMKLASGGTQFPAGEILLWDSRTGAALFTLKGHSKDVSSLAFSPDGMRLVSGGKDHWIKLWDTRTGTDLGTLAGHTAEVTSVAFSPDGSRIASTSGGYRYPGEVKLWDARTWDENRTLIGHANSVECVAFSPDGSRLASGGADRTIKLWNVRTGHEVRTLTGHSDVVTNLRFNSAGTQLVSISAPLPASPYPRRWLRKDEPDKPREIKLWDVDTGAEQHSFQSPFQTNVAISGDADLIAAGVRDDTIQVWETQTGNERRTFKEPSGRIESVIFHSGPDRSWLAVANALGAITFWDTQDWNQIRSFDWGYDGRAEYLAFSPDGRLLASARTEIDDEAAVDLGDVQSGTILRTLKWRANRLSSVAFSSDGARLVTASSPAYDQPGELKIWDVQSGAELRTLNVHSGDVKGLALSADGRCLASAGADGLIKLWDFRIETELRTLPAHLGGVQYVAFNHDGSTFATSGRADKSIKLWDATTKTERFVISDGSGSGHFLFAPQDALLATWGIGNSIKLWDIDTGNVRRMLTGHSDKVANIEFNNDGSHLASAGADKSIKVWDVKTGTTLHTFTGHSQVASRLVFSPNGSRLASTAGGFDQEKREFAANGEIKLWDLRSGKELRTLTRNSNYLAEMSFSADGTQLVGREFEERVIAWNVESGEAIEPPPVFPESRLPRNRFTDGKRLVFANYSGNSIRLVDQTFKDRSDEKLFREFKARLDPLWHDQFAAAAEQSISHRPLDDVLVMPRSESLWDRIVSLFGQQAGPTTDAATPPKIEPKPDIETNVPKTYEAPGPDLLATIEKSRVATEAYSAAFHLAWLLKARPEDADAHERLHSAYERWKANFQPLPPVEPKAELVPIDMNLAPIVREMLQQPRGSGPPLRPKSKEPPRTFAPISISPVPETE